MACYVWLAKVLNKFAKTTHIYLGKALATAKGCVNVAGLEYSALSVVEHITVKSAACLHVRCIVWLGFDPALAAQQTWRF